MPIAKYHPLRAGAAILVSMAMAMTLSPQAAIVGGHTIKIEAAPWQLYFKGDQGTGVTSGCGAVWIGGQWALTAAHCLEKAQITGSYIMAGVNRIDDLTLAKHIAVRRYISHPDYSDDRGVVNDIAVIELVKPIFISPAKPIPFATPADAAAGLTDAGVACIATGWGGINKSVEMPDSLQSVTSAVSGGTATLIKWAGQGGASPVGSCIGDSGGPLVVKDAAGTGWIVAGISSFITSFCGDPESPSSYTRVSAFADWIQQSTGISISAMDSRKTPVLPLLENGRLRLGQAQQLRLTWFDMLGNTLAQTNRHFEAGNHALQPAGWQAGAYILHVQGGDFRLHSRVNSAR